MSIFRIRKTDDKRGDWTVANGSNFANTNCYIDENGNKDSVCYPFSSSDQAQAALDLYLSKEKKEEKQGINDNTIKSLFQELADMEFHGHPGFYKLLADMAKLHSRKNHDYAGKDNPLRNFYKCMEQGIEPWRGVLVRLSDKWSRLESFCRQGTFEVKGESLVDTLMDNAVYSLLAILLFEEEFEKDKR